MLKRLKTRYVQRSVRATSHENNLPGTRIEPGARYVYPPSAERALTTLAATAFFSGIYLAKVTKYSLAARETLSPRRTIPRCPSRKLASRVCFRCTAVIARISGDCLSACNERNINGETLGYNTFIFLSLLRRELHWNCTRIVTSVTHCSRTGSDIH